MAYLTDFLGKPVTDSDGQRVGKVADLLVPAEVDYPPVTGAEIALKPGENATVPWTAVSGMDEHQMRLALPRERLAELPPLEGALRLARQVLDRQIIDVNGTRLVRVNDVQLTRTNGSYRLVSVDIGAGGLLRRLGVWGLAQAVAGVFRKELASTVIAWSHLSPVESAPSGLRLGVPRKDLAKLHPADLADILSHLDRIHSEQVIDSLDPERAAETLEGVAPELQVSVLEDMPEERAADILEEMGPDVAADVLADMSQERAESLLRLMDQADAQDVRELLGYPETSAGGIMTTDFTAVPEHLTARQAIDVLRQEVRPLDNLYYVYATDKEERLTGVISLKELILANPEAPLHSFMERNVMKVGPLDPQERVARTIAKYNLLAVPVVDDDQRVRGIVTVDDAIDIILPVAWKKRLPRLFS